MICHIRKTCTLAAAILALGSGVAQCQTTPTPKADTPGIEAVVRAYILGHPEVVLESIRLFQQREQAAQLERSREALVSKLDELHHDPSSPVHEPADRASDPVNIVAFFDYRCTYCKKADETIAKLAAAPGVRIVYKEYPILGPESVLAARAALAARKQSAYLPFHKALMTASGPVTQEAIDKLAAGLGLDTARLRKDMDSPEINAALSRNHQLGDVLGVQSTPTFIVGTRLVAGALTEDAFRPLIDAARAEAKKRDAPVSGEGFRNSLGGK